MNATLYVPLTGGQYCSKDNREDETIEPVKHSNIVPDYCYCESEDNRVKEEQ
jgi:hypothetical protein